MDSNVFVNRKIVKVCMKIYSEKETSHKKSWTSFILNEELKMGIRCIDFFYDKFQIIDEKKWLIAKIKYGF